MKDNSKWDDSTKQLAKELHMKLSINNKDWHKLKNVSNRRAAELLASAISQIVNNGKEADIESLINQALLWVNNKIKDPGCPSK